MDKIGLVNYLILAVLLIGAFVSLYLGLKKHSQRIAKGKPFVGEKPNKQAVLAKINKESFILRGLMTSRLLKRPVAGAFHAIMFIGALLLIFGHAVYPLSFIGVPVYEGLFGALVMEFGREIGGVMLFTGILFFLLRRLVPPERLIAGGKTRAGFELGEIALLIIVLIGFLAESLRLAFEPSSEGYEFLGGALAPMLNNLLGEEASIGTVANCNKYA